MRLLNLFESESIWFHGTPESQLINGRFEERTTSIPFLKDPAAWDRLQDAMNTVERGGKEYMAMVDKAGELRGYKSVRVPVFLTRNRSIAATYADDNRAFDYQSAIPKVLKVSVKDAPTLTVNGLGQSFRGISVDVVKRALSSAGIDDAKVDALIAQYSASIRGGGNKLSTDGLGAIADDAGFSIVDVKNIKDNYMGGGPAETVRMVLDMNLLTIVD